MHYTMRVGLMVVAIGMGGFVAGAASKSSTALSTVSALSQTKKLSAATKASTVNKAAITFELRVPIIVACSRLPDAMKGRMATEVTITTKNAITSLGIHDTINRKLLGWPTNYPFKFCCGRAAGKQHPSIVVDLAETGDLGTWFMEEKEYPFGVLPDTYMIEWNGQLQTIFPNIDTSIWPK